MTAETPEYSPDQLWLAPLQRAARAKAAAAAVLSATIGDAVAAGVTPTQVARHLGIRGRRGIYDAMEQARSGAGGTERPTPVPVIWLRGANADERVWKCVEDAMWRRGWPTTADRTAVWHLAHGQSMVVRVDFSLRKKGDVQVAQVVATKSPRSGRPASTQLQVVPAGTRSVAYSDTGDLDVDAVAIAVAEVIGLSLLGGRTH